MAKYFYNGILLPEIPATDYPYAVIRENNAVTPARYDLFLAKGQFVKSATISRVESTDQASGLEMYTVTKENSSSAEEWTFSQHLASGNVGVATNQSILWSNHNVPIGSITATDIYVYAMKAVPLLASTGFSYNGTLLPEIPSDVLKNYPYCWIRSNVRTGHYDLFMAKSPWWQSDSTTISTASYADGIQWYRTSITAPGDNWTFNQSWTTNGGMADEADRAILWANQNIPVGSVTGVKIYFTGSLAVPNEDAYRIRKDTLTGIAEQIRRLYISEETLTPAQMIAKLEAVQGIHIIVESVSKLPTDSPDGAIAIVEG